MSGYRVPPASANSGGRGHHLVRGDRMDDSTTPPQLATAVCVRCGTEYPFTPEFFVVQRGSPIRRCRVCNRARVTAWRNEHREECRAADRTRWRERKSDEEWREKRYARRRAYHETHRDQLLESNRQWRLKNVERHRENASRWAKNNRDRCNANARAWRARNPELQRAHAKAARARMRTTSQPGSISSADITAQYERQRGRCYWCEEKVGATYHVDHVIPLALGGANTADNIVISCPTCNSSKGAKHPMDFAGRLL